MALTDAQILTQVEAQIAAHPGQKSIQDGDLRTEYPDLADLIDLRDRLVSKTSTTAGTVSRRTVAKNGGI